MKSYVHHYYKRNEQSLYDPNDEQDLVERERERERESFIKVRATVLLLSFRGRTLRFDLQYKVSRRKWPELCLGACGDLRDET